MFVQRAMLCTEPLDNQVLYFGWDDLFCCSIFTPYSPLSFHTFHLLTLPNKLFSLQVSLSSSTQKCINLKTNEQLMLIGLPQLTLFLRITQDKRHFTLSICRLLYLLQFAVFFRVNSTSSASFLTSGAHIPVEHFMKRVTRNHREQMSIPWPERITRRDLSL